MAIKIKLTGIPFPQINCQMFLHLDWSSPLVHWYDWTWLYQVHKLTVHFWAYTKPRTWARHRIVCRPLRQNCIKAQIWGRVQKKLKVPVSRVTSIIHKWKKFGIMRTSCSLLPGQSKQLGKKGLSHGGDQEPDYHSDRAPALLCNERRTLQKDNPAGMSGRVVIW